MSDKSTLILTHDDIQQKIKRISYEILENNYDEKELHLIGIKDKGFTLAKKLHDSLKTISSIKISLNWISLDKKNPNRSELKYDFEPKDISGKVVLLVDDVGNTGRTLCYAMQPLLPCLPKKIETVVLVDRKHKLFPVCADYVGLSLSTTMKELVTVEFNGKGDAVYLS
ncbi:MAG TPA: phosphoribosyltransferase family protein [Chitinophagales bacterium]|nr:phosphoribosyltransferase family protein [Chitinophagales bacterium]